MIDNSKEYILCAAIHFDYNGEKTLHCCKNVDSGIVVCGRRHHNVFTLLHQLGLKRKDFGKETQGFITSHDRFLNRKEARDLAIENGQIETAEYSQLYSEDLY